MPAVKISMASAHDDTDLRGLPAAYLQQVMSPSGQAAAQQGHTPEAPDGVPNGTGDALTRSVRAGDDEAYVQALAGTAAVEMSGGVGGIAGEHRQSGSMTRSASAEPMGAEDRPLLPHAAMGTEVVPMVRETRGSASMLPSPLPSPMSTSGSVTQATDVASGVHGSSLAQHGAAAIRWFSKLGDYMQRRSTTVSRTQPGMETTVVRQETVWSPSGHRPAAAAGTDPLFSGAQVQRMQEMAAAAPQLYGASGTRGPSSEDSGSYSKDQLEAEVKRQVQAALSGQRDLMEENYKLRLEVERLARASASSEGGSFLPGDGRLVASPPGLSGMGQGSTGLPEGNPAGLPIPGREQGGDSDFRVAMEYLRVIFKDYQDRMEGSGWKDTWANMESLMAIYEDLWDRIVSKGVSLRMGFKRLGTQTSLREGYQEAIHQDFLYQVESKEVGFGFRRRAINGGILLKYLFVIHQ